MRGDAIKTGLFLASALCLGLGASAQNVDWRLFNDPVTVKGSPQVVRGKRVFDQTCLSCHGTGVRFPGTIGLQAKYKGEKPALLEERTDLTPEIVRYFVRNGVTTMPGFRQSELSESDLDALAAYLSLPPSKRRAGGPISVSQDKRR